MGGQFEGAPVALLYLRGRRSGREYVVPVMYLADDQDPATVYVVASNSGAPASPDWYYNLIHAGSTSIEVLTATYLVSVAEITGEKRDRIYAEQARRYPGFAEYEDEVAGVRTIPVLALRRN